MDEQEVIEIPEDEIEIIDIEDYREEVAEHFHQMPDVARPLMSEAKNTFHKIEKMLYSAPAFINAVKAAISDVTLQAVLSDKQKSQLAKGALKLMTKKDGSLMANLVNQETKKIVSTIPLKSVQMAPEMTQADKLFNADADGTNCGTDTSGSTCCRRSKTGPRIRPLSNRVQLPAKVITGNGN